MNQVLDKLGIYDLVAVLLSGIIAVGITLISDSIFFNIGLSSHISTDDTIIFFVLSYLVGVIFQEIGHLLHRRILNKNDKILKNALDTSRDHCLLSVRELERVYAAAREQLSQEEIDDTVLFYNYCRHLGGRNTSADKDHSVAAMSRSLSLFFILLGLAVIITAIYKCMIWYIGCAGAILLVAALLWNRSNRFYEIRYVRIIRTFYYSYLDNKTKSSDSSANG